MLFELLSDIVANDDVLFIVKSNAATCEVRSNSLNIKQKEKWITIGDNDDPAHMHINSELIKSAKFLQEEKPERTSFSVQFFDEYGDRVLAAFFTKMYDGTKTIIPSRKKLYEDLNQKYSSSINF
ncbi:ChuX/HutX family heme-like substrate-binding protein [Nitrosopumilus sp.]|uniref:ChuX/HutX family heme-like substrate-binding protein n=1 Tax=Nitrosopumilus sp. TaxID=2024843 RepID=UPI00247D587C|nr:ChuX/HutX family heme-like substrate-binding protein [Nitrosopumilus sp.]MCV0411218.1 hemin-degrading factor [Nitrosopumilus sp.]